MESINKLDAIIAHYVNEVTNAIDSTPIDAENFLCTTDDDNDVFRNSQSDDNIT